MESKPFKSIEEQIIILKSRGLIIEDDEYAKKILIHINYYRLSGYTLTLRRNNVFNKNIKIEQIMEIYKFDYELRNLISSLLEYIEVSFRTHFGYFHAKEYGPLGYLDKENFDKEEYYEKFYSNIEQFIKENGKNEAFIKHHEEKYDGKFPVWTIVELMSFGCLSRGFKNLKEDIKREICLECYKTIPYSYIENWLRGFVILRNICAHRGRLYNRYISFSPKFSQKDKRYLRGKGIDLNETSKRVFGYIYIIFKLIKDDEIKNDFIDRFSELINKYSFVKIEHYGFNKEWKEILNNE
ncbi:MAG: Abi family protein [Clostridium sp.]|uniref:Abi family protein n=1 Tax=Clostridium sp. TaxID=1506 RepID=UPI003F41ACB9